MSARFNIISEGRPQPVANRIKPIYVMHEDGVTPDHVVAVSKGIAAVLDAAGMRQRIEVHHFGAWRHAQWRQGTTLRPHCSVEWYLDEGRKHSKKDGQLYEPAISNALYNDPWQESQPHYDLVILKSDLYAEGCNFIIGAALKGKFCLVSVNRFLGLSAKEQEECIATETIHELGHVFGLPHDDRNDGAIEESLGGHCTNRCTMRQGLVVPRDWQYMTTHRLQHGPFCPTCKQELRQFFCQ